MKRHHHHPRSSFRKHQSIYAHEGGIAFTSPLSALNTTSFLAVQPGCVHLR
jgi:hypothetical protein